MAQETREDLLRRRTRLLAGQQMVQGLGIIGAGVLFGVALWVIEARRFSLASIAIILGGIGVFFRGFAWWAST